MQRETHRITRIGRAWNPSLIRYNGAFLMAFNSKSPGMRHCTVKIAYLDDSLEVKNEIFEYSADRDVSDMRLFLHDAQLFGTFFRGDQHQPGSGQVLVRFSKGIEIVETHDLRYGRASQFEKNWQFFSHDRNLFAIYSVQPHKILSWRHGQLSLACETSANLDYPGKPSGGTPPVKFGREYLSFFHAWQPWNERGASKLKFRMAPLASLLNRLVGWPFPGACTWPHRIYSLGAYTFDQTPPFRILRYTRRPIMTAPISDAHAGLPACVFPCGAYTQDNVILVSIGYHDRECQVLKLEASELETQLCAV